MKKWLSYNKVFVRTFAFSMAVLVIIFCIPVKSHADEEVPDANTVPLQLPVSSPPIGSSNGLYLGKYQRENVYAASSGADIYVCFVESYPSGGNSWTVYFSFDESATVNECTEYSIPPQSSFGLVEYSTGLYTHVAPGDGSALPSFPTIEDAVEALNAHLSPSSPTRFEFDYDLPPGNILYIRKGIDSSDWDSDLTLTAEFPLQSDIGSDHFVRSFYVGDAESLPSSETVFPDDLGNLLSEVYLGVGDPKTALGQSRYGYLHSSEAASIYPYLVIYNPVRTGVYDTMSSTEQNMYANVNLHVHLEAAAAAYAWPLTSNFTIAGGVTGTTTQDPADSEFQITYDTETQTWDTVDSEGDPGTLIPGGNTIIDTSSTSIKGLLQDFLSKFTRIFEKSYDAISGLINAGGAFIVKLGGIFAWLPSPVYSVLSSALVLVVVIGTLKVLL